MSPEPEAPDGREVFVSSAYRVPRPDAGRAARGARLAAPLDRRRRRARQDDDRGDDRVRAARARARPGLADRRRGAAARGERGRGGRLARRRGRRVRPDDRVASARDRGDHERRPRPPRDLRVARRGGGGVRAVRGAGEGGRARRRARAVPGRARGPRRAQPPQRGGGARGARGGRRRRGPTRSARSRRSAARDAGSSSAARPAGSPSTTTTRTTRPRSRPCSAAAREARPEGRVLVLFQPHLFSRTRHSAHELGGALAAADAVAVTEIYPAREQPMDGVTGKLVVDALAEARPGAAGRLDAAARGRRPLPRRARAAGRRRAHGRRRRRRPCGPAAARGALVIEERVPLSRFTTIGTGGPARALARPESVDELRRGARRGLPSAACRCSRSGSARTSSSRTRASTRSSSSSRERWRRVEVDGGSIRAGGGAKNADLPPRGARRRPRRLRVRVRDPGHDRRRCAHERRRVRRRLRLGARARARRRRRGGASGSSPDELGLAYRRSALEPGQVVAEVELRLEPAPRAGDPRDRHRAAGTAKGRPADEQADLRQRLQEPRARADRGPDARSLRPARPSDRWSADLAPPRQLHRERRGRAVGGRRRADGGGAPPRVRALRRRARARGRLPRPASSSPRARPDAQERRPGRRTTRR